MKKLELSLYHDLLRDIKTRVRQAQRRAAFSANAEMIAMYWDIGHMIAARQKQEGWGAGVLPRLAVDLKNDLPEEKGFSLRNLKLMLQFYHTYPGLLTIGQRPVAQLPGQESTGKGQPPVAQIGTQPAIPLQDATIAEIMQQAVAQLSWAHNIILIQKVKDMVCPPRSRTGLVPRHAYRANQEQIP